MSYYGDLVAQREKRLAKNKAMATNESMEYLLIENLNAKAQLWGFKDDDGFSLRVVPYVVSQKENCANEDVGTLAAVRRVRIHYMDDKSVKVCPRTFGCDCPRCDKYHELYDSIKDNKKHPAHKLKAKDIALFNALMRISDGNGETKSVMRVVRTGWFSSYGKILDAVKKKAANKLYASQADVLYSFDDPEEGYWFDIEVGKDTAVQGGGVEFFQFTSVNPLWQKDKYPRKPLSEKICEAITDIDKLIPPAPSYAELAKMSGLDITAEAEVEVETKPEHVEEDENLDDDRIDVGVVGAAVVVDQVDGEVVLEGEDLEDVKPPVEKPKAKAKPVEVAKPAEVAKPVETVSKTDDDDFDGFDA